MSLINFSDFLTLNEVAFEFDDDGSGAIKDGSLTQSAFSTHYAAWLASVFSDENVQAYLAENHGISITGEVGPDQIEIYQNDDSLLPTIDGFVDSDVQAALAALFGGKDEMDVITGRTTQERSYVYEFDPEAWAAMFPPMAYEIDLTGGMVQRGVAGEDGQDAIDDSPWTDGADGGTVHEVPDTFDLIVIQSTGDEPNAIIGGAGGHGGRSTMKLELGGEGGSGGHAIVNGSIIDVSITGNTTLTILGGTHGDDGSWLAKKVVKKKKIGEEDEDDGIYSASAFSHEVNIDASTFDAHLTISGSDYDDTMTLGLGGSQIYATAGADTYHLGEGADVVVYSLIEHSTADMSDTIVGFTTGEDLLDFSRFVYVSGKTKQPNWIGDEQFSGTDTIKVGYMEIRREDANTLQVDVSGDGQADMEIIINDASLLTESDFLLF